MMIIYEALWIARRPSRFCMRLAAVGGTAAPFHRQEGTTDLADIVACRLSSISFLNLFWKFPKIVESSISENYKFLEM